MIKDPKCRLCRREGSKLFLKGSKCYTPKCPLAKRQTKPGQHGIISYRTTEYAKQLREKQKVKRMYGMRERQFRRFYQMATKISKNQNTDKGYTLLQLLERRLDNVLYRSGLVKSKPLARQIISHKHISVNGKRVRSSSTVLKEGDKVEISKKVLDQVKPAEPPIVPNWLATGKNQVEVKSLPSRDQIDPTIKENLVVELYSR